MANPFRIARSNYADNAILSSGSEITSLPIANLKDSDIQRIWRSNSSADQQLLVLADLGQTRTIATIALINCNVFSPATFHVRVSTVDATGIAGDAYNQALISGIVDGAHPNFVYVIEPAVSGRYVRLNGNSLTQIPEAGRLMISDIWAPSRNVSLVAPPEDVPFDHSRVTYSEGLNRYVDARARERRFRWTLRGIPTAEKIAQIDEINRLRGTKKELLVIFDKDSSNLGRDSIWGTMPSLLNPRRMAKIADAWQCNFEVWELV